MGKYSSNVGRGAPPPQEIHAIWRGIGLVLMVVTPFLAYMGTLVLLEQNQTNGWVAIPRDMLSPVIEPLLYVKIGMTLALAILLYGVFQLISFIFYSMFAPPRYGPLDAPPIDKNPRHYKR